MFLPGSKVPERWFQVLADYQRLWISCLALMSSSLFAGNVCHTLTH